jgi:hypothetical protein
MKRLHEYQHVPQLRDEEDTVRSRGSGYYFYAQLVLTCIFLQNN